jgi:hypothetical protein
MYWINFFIFLCFLKPIWASDQKFQEQLEHRLRQTLEYQGSGFSRAPFENISRTNFLKALQAFEKALDTVKFLKSFKNINHLWISKNSKSKSFHQGRGIYSYYLPESGELAEYIKLLSSKPIQEPELKKYYQGHYDSNFKKLTHLKSLNPLGQRLHQLDSMVCQTIEELNQFYTQNENAKINSFAHKIEYINQAHQNNPYEFKLHLYIKNQRIHRRSIQVNYKKNNKYSNLRTILTAKYSGDCQFKSAKIWEYNDKYITQKVYWINNNGEVSDYIYANKPALSLENIYPQSDQKKEYSQNQEKVLVSILDNGVDYNHPELAYKMHRDHLGQLIALDLKDNDGLPYDFYEGFQSIKKRSYQHGTHVAGIICKDNEKIKLLPIRYTKESYKSYYDAIKFAYDQGSRFPRYALCGGRRQ